MEKTVVRKAPLPWLAAGVLLGLAQLVAIGAKKPLGVSTQFVVADTQLLNKVAPEYAQAHPLISKKKYQNPGYGWWFDIGLLAGACAAALASKRWRLSTTPVWWRRNRGGGGAVRLGACFVGGFFILIGARLAHGCTSGQFASGWAQLSLSAVPFTIAMFGFAMLTARLFYAKTPDIDR